MTGKHIALAALLPLLVPMTADGQCLETVEPSDGADNFRFGTAVSTWEDVVVIGAPRAMVGGTFDVGAAYVYRQNGPLWVDEQKLVASDGADSDAFGTAVSVAGDRAVIGAPSDDDMGEVSGSAYVFTKTGGAWSQVQKLLPSIGATGDEFGAAVAIYGSTCAVGAPHFNGVGTDDGAVFVYEETGGLWSEQVLLQAFDHTLGFRFGYSIDLHGSTLLVGSPGARAAYVYTKAGPTWVQQAKLEPSGSLSGGTSFGSSVAVWESRIAVGAADGVYTFQKTPLGWGAVNYLPFPIVSETWLADIAGDGLIVGSIPNAGPESTVRLYAWSGNSWTLKLVKKHPFSKEYGRAVALSSETLAIGDPEAEASQGAADVGSYLPLLEEVSLDGCPLAISVGSGGSQSLSLHTDADHAGEWYFVLGSLSGDVPGFQLGGYHIQLNPDPYLEFALTNPNNPPPLSNTFGLLDKNGLAQASIVWPSGFATALIGSTLHHAFVAFDLTTLTITASSNSAKLLLVP